ncbi:hypothetical protein AKJ09_00078 [Labilithrix luteola]|uniref:Uncharacterized protein n=1 Tax=Labilithrix luteola TaxID=1391654 RepID=A0A0K1PJX5_9BACT|nr:hypothetical protein [Labilithrix luteola]AKU93346.1 hypothetical protein AKJ09_00010 [Labilithrix luteola]AKU93414.1 hypothetical protein AKJ09_00078 [Labilithrix luteola]
MKFTVHSNKRYAATIKLGFFERLASNDTIAEKLRFAGFIEVNVVGEGRDRTAFGTWPGADASAELPSQIVSVVEAGR